MSSTSRLYSPLLQLFRQQVACCDIRHLNTLAWIVVALIASGSIALTAWGVYVHTCATQAQSHQRCWQRGMSYLKIGWNWVRMGLAQGWKLTVTLALSGQSDPQPAISSKRQFQERLEQPEFNFIITSYGNPA
ncbi:hypothetical protein [Candidatus Cyanaurora vandensis]|uniref:hypothetical protein n=1 Tax=Candidatus Cyanaurora vandensis TaxID=2714958 RepID=UPI00257A4EE9|nr:hypothetical protein [Candidatus Cyanaurora vandensis]